MKNLKKITIILLTMLMCLSMITNSSYASNAQQTFADGSTSSGAGAGTQGGGDWKSITQFDGKGNDSLDSATRNIVGAIVSVIRIVGTGISIIMLVAVAIKYMSAAPGDRAEIKKHAVIYVVGAIVLFGGAQLIGIIQNFASNIKA